MAVCVQCIGFWRKGGKAPPQPHRQAQPKKLELWGTQGARLQSNAVSPKYPPRPINHWAGFDPWRARTGMGHLLWMRDEASSHKSLSSHQKQSRLPRGHTQCPTCPGPDKSIRVPPQKFEAAH